MSSAREVKNENLIVTDVADAQGRLLSACSVQSVSGGCSTSKHRLQAHKHSQGTHGAWSENDKKCDQPVGTVAYKLPTFVSLAMQGVQ